MPNRGEYADAARKRIADKRVSTTADTVRMPLQPRVPDAGTNVDSTGPDGAVRVEAGRTVGGRGAIRPMGETWGTVARGTVGDTPDGVVSAVAEPGAARPDAHHEIEDLEAVSKSIPPKMKGLHKLARYLGKKGGEAAMADAPPYDWAKSVGKGAKATGTTAVVVSMVLGLARGAGIELWNPENDEAAIVILVGSISVITGIVHGITNWRKHK